MKLCHNLLTVDVSYTRCHGQTDIFAPFDHLDNWLQNHTMLCKQKRTGFRTARSRIGYDGCASEKQYCDMTTLSESYHICCDYSTSKLGYACATISHVAGLVVTPSTELDCCTLPNWSTAICYFGINKIPNHMAVNKTNSKIVNRKDWS